MSGNNNLLSQHEIDTLIDFLRKNPNTPISAVLDQDSIDRLIVLVQQNNSKGIYLNNQENYIDISPVSLKINGTVADCDNCIIECKFSENGYMQLYCCDSRNDAKYRISPNCLIKGKYTDDDAEWGYAIPPKALIAVSKLFDLRFNDDTLDFVKKNFSKLMYGSADAPIPAFYFDKT